MAMANSAGRIPRTTSTAHQATARVRSARGKTPKNSHSLRARRRSIIGAAPLRISGGYGERALAVVRGLAVSCVDRHPAEGRVVDLAARRGGLRGSSIVPRARVVMASPFGSAPGLRQDSGRHRAGDSIQMFPMSPAGIPIELGPAEVRTRDRARRPALAPARPEAAGSEGGPPGQDEGELFDLVWYHGPT